MRTGLRGGRTIQAINPSHTIAKPRIVIDNTAYQKTGSFDSLNWRGFRLPFSLVTDFDRFVARNLCGM
jgi:hypothetical protein